MVSESVASVKKGGMVMYDSAMDEHGVMSIDTGTFPQIELVGESNPDVLFGRLVAIVERYHPSDDFKLMEKAYRLAKEAHEGQFRQSGEPYVFHPVSVAIMLAHLELDKETIIAGLLHGVINEAGYASDVVEREFGEEIASLVDGVTKLTRIDLYQDKLEEQGENLRKMFLAMAKDIRVILVKLADRLHNMRTLAALSPERQREKARETMDIYAPIADRLGISKMKVELDDLSFRYLQPEEYERLTSQLEVLRKERETFISDVVADVKRHVDELGMEATVDGRVKHYLSIYRKMVRQNKPLEQIYDLFAVRIIVNDVQQCYAALGVIHEMYKPMPGRFKDYIAMPKPNMYQSLHTTLVGPGGQVFEIQIRTHEMHRTAEYGIAAHWKYKENRAGMATLVSEEEKMAWLRRILEWQTEMSDNKEFLNLLKSDLNLYGDSVFCFTPDGDVKNLPSGSTPIDFAYAIHSGVGNRMVGAKANGNLVNIEYEIQNGDQIEILTSQSSKGPSRDWLAIVKSTQAKNKINQWFKDELKEENVIRGKELISNYCKGKSIVLSDLLKPKFVDACLRRYGFRDWESICAAVGHGGLKEGQVVNRLVAEHERLSQEEMTDEQVLEFIDVTRENRPTEVLKTKGGILVRGAHDVAVRFSKCCNPVPGDEIVGFVTRGRGVSIHRTDCVNMEHLSEGEEERLIEAQWHVSEGEEGDKKLYLAEIVVYAHNRRGIVLDLTKAFNEQMVDVRTMDARTSKQGTATISIGFEINGVKQLNHVVSKIRMVEGVLGIERV